MSLWPNVGFAPLQPRILVCFWWYLNFRLVAEGCQARCCLSCQLCEDMGLD